MDNGILFLCAENVCRSPLMSYQLRYLARDSRWADSWRVSSAGVRVRQTNEMCEVARATVDTDAELSQRIALHESRGMSTSMLRDADLIITASRAERAAAARMSPDVRVRAFTLKEAVSLSSLRALPSASRLADVSAELNSRRGLAVVADDATTGRWPRRHVHPLDVPDDHGARAGRHVATLRSVKQLIGELYAAVESAMD